MELDDLEEEELDEEPEEELDEEPEEELGEEPDEELVEELLAAAIIAAAAALTADFAFTLLRFAGEGSDEEEPDEEERFFRLAFFAFTILAFLREAGAFLGFSTRLFSSARRASCFICHGPPLA
jgi:hypothetical protein